MRIILQIRVWGHIFQAFAYQIWYEPLLHMIFLCYSKDVLEHIFDVFTRKFTCHCDLILSKSKQLPYF
jgi:hypothetical protein